MYFVSRAYEQNVTWKTSIKFQIFKTLLRHTWGPKTSTVFLKSIPYISFSVEQKIVEELHLQPFHKYMKT